MADVPNVPDVPEEKTEHETTFSPSNHLLQLKVWQKRKKKELSEVQLQILDVVAYGIATEEAAEEAATQLDAWCPPLDQDPNAKNYIWAIWDLVTYIVESHEVTSEMQDGVIRLLHTLQQIPKGTVNAFGVCSAAFVSSTHDVGKID